MAKPKGLSENHTVIKRWLTYLILLAGVVLVYVLTNTWYTLLAVIVVILTPLLSLLLMLISARAVRLRFKLPTQMTKNRSQFECIIENTSWLLVARLQFDLVIENSLTGTIVMRSLYTLLGSRHSYTVQLALHQAKAGMLVIGATNVSVWDCLGMFRLRRPDSEPQSTVVYPELRDVQVQIDRPVESLGEGVRHAVDKKGNDLNEVLSLREYEPGDEVRHIHWKLSGKLDTVMVRDFSLPLNYSVFLLAEFTRGHEKATDTMAEMFLSLSHALIESGIYHNLGWYDAAAEELQIRELSTVEDLEVASAAVLETYAALPSFAPALESYKESGYLNGRTVLVYLSSDLAVEDILEVELSQKVTVVFIGDKKAVRAAEATGLTIEPVLTDGDPTHSHEMVIQAVQW